MRCFSSCCCWGYSKACFCGSSRRAGRGSKGGQHVWEQTRDRDSRAEASLPVASSSSSGFKCRLLCALKLAFASSHPASKVSVRIPPQQPSSICAGLLAGRVSSRLARRNARTRTPIGISPTTTTQAFPFQRACLALPASLLSQQPNIDLCTGRCRIAFSRSAVFRPVWTCRGSC